MCRVMFATNLVLRINRSVHYVCDSNDYGEDMVDLGRYFGILSSVPPSDARRVVSNGLVPNRRGRRIIVVAR